MNKMTQMGKQIARFSGLLALIITGCTQQDQNKEQAKLYENGTAKPVVAITPLLDSARHTMPWNVASELSSLIHYRLMQRDTLYLVDQDKVASLMKHMKEHHLPFNTDYAWTKNIFSDDEFVVFAELIHHEETPVPTKGISNPDDLPIELSMHIRVRVIDLRPSEPTLILQEIIQDTHLIPKEFTKNHFTQVEWGKDNYAISPIGMAHAHISKEVAMRLEEYILRAMQKAQS